MANGVCELGVTLLKKMFREACTGRPGYDPLVGRELWQNRGRLGPAMALPSFPYAVPKMRCKHREDRKQGISSPVAPTARLGLHYALHAAGPK